jgi:hypothetical protein
MSNALAIASVTALLKDLLNDGLINRNLDSLFNFQVTAQPPDRISPADQQDVNRLNLFLYRVAPNTGWANVRYPSRSSSGTPVENPFLALDLHYLLSAFASQDLNAEILLGYGMQVLHETPVLDRGTIREALGAGGPVNGALLPPGFQQLSPADLADQFEQVKIAPYHVDLEDLSKIWMAMNTPLRMSALYQVTVVLIESDASTRSALPVLERALFVRQLQRPRIVRLLSLGPSDAEPSSGRRIVHGDVIVLQGSGLRGEVTVVTVGEFEETPAEVTDRSIQVAIPAGARPGVTAVQIVHRIPKLPPSTEQMPGEISNLVAFVLHPSLAAVDPIELSGVTLEDAADPTGPVRGSLVVRFAHPVGTRQRVDLLLNELSPPADRAPFEYTFSAASLPPPPPEEVTERTFEFRQVEQETYLLRVRVDGAESVPETTGGTFSGPTVEIQT